MAGAIGVAAALRARFIEVRCPFCGHTKQVERSRKAPAVSYRVCPRCHKHFSAPGDKVQGSSGRKR